MYQKRSNVKNGHLIRAVETRGYDFAYDVHEMFSLLDDIVYFAEGGCAPHRRLFDCELQLLYVCGYFI